MNSSFDERLRSVWRWQYINQKALDELENSLRCRLDRQDDSEARDELEQLKFCREELENFAILSLWAVFEEMLNSWLAQRTYWAVASGEGDRKIRESLLRRIQYWSMAEKIDALQPVFGNEVTHNLQNLRKWRDWVAHRKTEPRPEAVDADMAESLFSAVIAELETYPEDRIEALV